MNWEKLSPVKIFNFLIYYLMVLDEMDQISDWSNLIKILSKNLSIVMVFIFMLILD